MPHFPCFESFRQLAGRSNLVTVFRRLTNDLLTPVGAFHRLGGDQNESVFLLESVEGGDRIARYSYLAVDPFLSFSGFGREAKVSRGNPPNPADWDDDGTFVGEGDPLDALQEVLQGFQAESVGGLPDFCGGAVGYLGYDTVRYSENLPDPPPDDRHLPDLAFDFYGSVIIFDHAEKTITVTAHARMPNGPEPPSEDDLKSLYDDACGRIDDLVKQLERPVELPMADIDPRRPIERPLESSNFTQEGFETAVEKCKQYIVAGDIFQVVISQRFETQTTASPFDIYRALRVVNPSPFMFYLRVAGVCLVGSSPELMVGVQDGLMTIRPLAGTRPRGATVEEDLALEEELLADPKERAEHVMLVDLARNDIGRIARFGSVNLDQVMCIERYSHVMHISSTVTGQLAEGKTALDAVRSSLPAGTVSGAPKVRAMEIIDELEPHRRGPYAGAVGYLDFSGNIETCLTLRTLVCQDDKVYIQAGAGIVADSVPRLEYQETINKAKGLLKAIEIAEQWS